MPRKKLTYAFVNSAKPIGNKLTEYADEKETGLCLRVTPAGSKSPEEIERRPLVGSMGRHDNTY